MGDKFSPRMHKTAAERFLEKAEITENCWLWEGAFNANGYGRFSLGGQSTWAHRAAYRIFIGEIPEGEGWHGTCVCHKCDIKHCVNPAHLFLGTAKDNVLDRDEKGRGVVAVTKFCEHGLRGRKECSEVRRKENRKRYYLENKDKLDAQNKAARVRRKAREAKVIDS